MNERTAKEFKDREPSWRAFHEVCDALEEMRRDRDELREKMGVIARLSRLAWTSPETVRQVFEEIHRIAKEKQ